MLRLDDYHQRRPARPPLIVRPLSQFDKHATRFRADKTNVRATPAQVDVSAPGVTQSIECLPDVTHEEADVVEALAMRPQPFGEWAITERLDKLERRVPNIQIREPYRAVEDVSDVHEGESKWIDPRSRSTLDVFDDHTDMVDPPETRFRWPGCRLIASDRNPPPNRLGGTTGRPVDHPLRLQHRCRVNG